MRMRGVAPPEVSLGIFHAKMLYVIMRVLLLPRLFGIPVITARLPNQIGRARG